MQRLVPRNHQAGFSIVWLCVVVIVAINLGLVGILAYRLQSRRTVNDHYKNDAVHLQKVAADWRNTHHQRWPQQCIIQPGTQKLCTTDADRNDIVAAAQNLSRSYGEVFVVDAELMSGDIQDNRIIKYALVDRGGLILVNKASCLSKSKISQGGSFAVIYPQQIKSGNISAVCL